MAARGRTPWSNRKEAAKRETKRKASEFKAPAVSDEAKRLFDALTAGNGRFDSPGERRFKGFALMSVLHDGEPTAAIVFIEPPKLGSGSDEFTVTPVFVQVTDNISKKLRDPHGEEPKG